jgi:YHS domain-containing protein
MDFFNALFLTDSPGAVQTVTNVLIGPIVAVLTFVCSVGNIPLAAVLWAGGISFAGVLAFIYADLLIVPLVIVYLRYYGRTVTRRLLATMFVAIAASALIVDGIFSAAGIVPETRPSIESITERGIAWNYTTFLNAVFFAVAAALFALTLRRGARDPVCGMTVDRSKTPFRSEYKGKTVYFCSAGCKASFDADPARYVDPAGREAQAL